MQQATIAKEIQDAVCLLTTLNPDVLILRIVASAHGYRQLCRDADPLLFRRVFANAPDELMGLPVVVDNFQTERWTIVCGGKA